MSRRTIKFELAEPLEVAREHMLNAWVEDLRRVHAWPESGGEAGIIYRTRYYRWWVYVVSICLFPIGLLSLLARKGEDFIQVELSESDGTTEVEVVGNARPKIWRVVERWSLVS